MKKETKKVAIPLLLGIVLIAMVGTFAAIYTSTTTQANVSTDNLGIAIQKASGPLDLLEKGKVSSTELANYTAVPGATVDEALNVKNTGSRAAYIRVTINRSWQKDSTKVSTLDPAEIGIITKSIADEGGSGNWYIDSTSDANHEQIVMYYKKPVDAGASTDNFMDQFTVLLDKINENTNSYSGYEVHLEFKADGIQTSAAKDAMLAEWGVKVNLDSSGNITAMPTEQQD